MATFVECDPELMEFQTAGDEKSAQLTLIALGMDDQHYRLIFEGKALLDLVDIFRAIQADLPGALGGH